MNASTIVSFLVAGIVVSFGAYIGYQNRRLLFDTYPPSTTTRYVPNPHNDKALIVYGWSVDEIKKILNDFATVYEIQRFRYRVRAEDERLRVVFPDDIEPRLFSFLVNYVQYAKDFDLKDRTIVSIGTATLSRDFGLPDAALSGQKSVFYVPIKEDEFDLVFVSVGEQTYANSFAGKCWQPVDDSRMPSRVQALSSEAHNAL